MKIAFVGKGGSGKTTVSSLFALFAQKHSDVMAIDADVNIHMKDMLGFDDFPLEKYLSANSVSQSLKQHIYNDSPLITSLSDLKKTTPPSSYAGYVNLSAHNCPVLGQISESRNSLSMSVVGSYDEDGIGKSCYHVHLGSLELLLSHLVHHNHTVVVDMVAGVDAFANSLHAQFDMFVLVVEPTLRSVSVYGQFMELARAAGVSDMLYVVVNKVEVDDDLAFVAEHIPSERILGAVKSDSHVRNVDRGREMLSVDATDTTTQATMNAVMEQLRNSARSYNELFQLLCSVHKGYVSQPHINDMNLLKHIQSDFDMDSFISETF